VRLLVARVGEQEARRLGDPAVEQMNSTPVGRPMSQRMRQLYVGTSADASQLVMMYAPAMSAPTRIISQLR
jgi:hypothetical protein